MKKKLIAHMAWVVPLLCAVWLVSKARPESDAPGEMRIHAFGKLPVVYQGRVKPLDTLARNSLTIISDKQVWRDENGEKRPAIEWLLDVISNSEAAYRYPVFRIVNLEVLDVLGLEQRKRFRYAFEEFQDNLPKLEEQLSRVHSLPDSERGAYETAVMETYGRIALFSRLIDSHMIPPVREDAAFEDMRQIISYYDRIRRDPLPHVIPPVEQDGEWMPFIEAAIVAFIGPGHAEDGGSQATSRHPALPWFTQMFVARRAADVGSFNAALDQYEAWLAENPVTDGEKLGFEAFYNHFAPFYQCSVLYVFAFLLGCFSWLYSSEVLRRTAFWLMVVTFSVHLFALAARIYISGYPPVTNLYGSAIFIGGGCVGLGLVIERLFRLGIGNVVAAVTGFLSLLVAHFLSLDGDTMEMMQAVLDTKFWLATHVVTVTLGYTATYFAGFIAILYLFRGIFTRSLTPKVASQTGSMMYGIICFALLLSFVGTVLGGLWADDSWGRFWGWDPKENGALMIVIWNAVILHARWAGMIRTRGLALMAIGGNIITTWSWFGVNQLGIGLHSYGFISSVTFWILVFSASQIALIGLGSLPKRKWLSTKALMSGSGDDSSQGKGHGLATSSS